MNANFSLQAGDLTYRQHLLMDDQVDGMTENPAVSLASQRAMKQFTREEPTVPLPAHDPEAAKRLADGLTSRSRPLDHALMKILHALFFVFVTVAAIAADNPYDETADAKLEIKQALTQVATTKTPIIIVFGANWCGDCKKLDLAMKNGATAPLLARDFKIVKVSVGHWDKNLDVAKAYGVPLEKGIPAVAIISAKNEVLYVTREGELANARSMGDKGIYEFFKRVTAEALAKK